MYIRTSQNQNNMALTKKEKVLQTALKMMADGGFHDTPMSELAAKSGVAIGTIYHHFSDKQALSNAIAKQCLDNRNNAMNAAVANSGTQSEKFQAMWTATFNHFCASKFEFLFLEQCQNSPLFAKMIVGNKNAIPAEVQSYLKNGVNTGKLRNLDTALLFDCIMAGIGVAVRQQIGSKSKKLTAKQIEELMLMGWAAIKAKTK